jgi:DNA-binding SARP family transcriptional activator
MFAENPYFHRGPIRHPGHFIGRTHEVASTLGLLRNGQSVSIVGQRRIGKSSFLLHISHPEVMVAHNLRPEETIFVFVDCEGLNRLDQAGFYRVILEETEFQLHDQNLDVDVPIPETLNYRQFERTLRGLTRQGFKLIYLLDEFELMSENHNLDADFFSGLRGLAARYDICYVTASQAHLLELSYAEGVLGSPFFNIFAVQHLNLFSQEDCAQFVHTPSRAAGLVFPQEIASYLQDLAGRHPLFLTIACFHTFAWLQAVAAGPDSSPPGRVPRSVEERILHELDGHLRFYWSKLEPQEQRILLNLPIAVDGGRTRVLLNKLQQDALVLREGDRFRLFSQALGRFLQRQGIEDQETDIEMQAEGDPERAIDPYSAAPAAAAWAQGDEKESAPRLSLQLLGSFTAELNSEPITAFESDKVRALFAYLAVESERPHRREKLAGLLWPNWPERSARQNLSHTLYCLRTAIGDRDTSAPLLHATNKTILLNHLDFWCDVTNFAQLLHTGARCSGDHDRASVCGQCKHILSQAVELYQGDFLEGFSLPESTAFEQWLLTTRERCHLQALDALHALADYHQRRGDHKQALLHARRALELEPTSEASHRQVMHSLAAAGQRSAALAQYESCRHLLAEQLGAEPSQETRVLHQKIRAAQSGRLDPASPGLRLP